MDLRNIEIIQPENGYRFSEDSTNFAALLGEKISSGSKVMDLGSGCGVIPVLIALSKQEEETGINLSGIEINSELFTAALANLEKFQLENQLSFFHGDYRRDIPGVLYGEYDWVITNPPYLSEGSGKSSPDAGRREAREELNGGISENIDTALRLLKKEGWYGALFPASRMAELIHLCREKGLEPKELFFLGKPEGNRSRIALLCRRGAGVGLSIGKLNS